jgi:hypothetical protein
MYSGIDGFCRRRDVWVIDATLFFRNLFTVGDVVSKHNLYNLYRERRRGNELAREGS